MAVLRLYVFLVAGATLLLTPVALFQVRVTAADSTGALSGAYLPDGSLRSRAGVITHVRAGEGSWMAAASFPALRTLSAAPAGTEVAYRLAGSGRELRTTLLREERSSARVVILLSMAAVCISCCVSALALAISGAGIAPLLAGAALAGLGGIFGDQFIQAGALRLGGMPFGPAATAAWHLLPRQFGPVLLTLFLTRFPTRQPAGRVTRLLLAVAVAAVALWWAIRGLGAIPGALDHLPGAMQGRLLSLMQPAILQLVAFLASSAALTGVAVAQWRWLRTAGRDRDRRNRGVVAAAVVLLGVGPTMLAVAVQSASMLFAGRQVIPIVAMGFSFLPMVLIPAGLTYAVLGRRVESFGFLVRRALLFTFAARTVRVVCLLPAVLVAVLLVRHRDQSLSALFRTFPVTAPVALAAAFVGLSYGDRAQRLLERIFFRERVAARGILQSLAEKTRGVTDSRALASLVCGEVDRAFHLESVTLLLADARGETYASTDGRTSLSALSELIARVERTESALDVQREARWPPQEEEWLEGEQVRLLVPLRSGDGGLLGVLALGERRSELPFDADDLEMLHLVGTAAGLAVENQMLRSSPSGSRLFLPEGEPADEARYCAACRSVLSGDARLCPYDGTALTPADVPVVVNAKYRVEERLGAGGMGVVYRARDLALGRAVALKTMPALSTREASRLLREARALASLSHEHLAVVFAVESWRGRPILVFEYLPGGTLEQRTRERVLDVAEVLSIGSGIAGALAVAHDAGMLHRDVKPSNIGFDGRGTPKLFDFGLARLTAELGRRSTSPQPSTELSSGLGGTPSYLAPEVVLGDTASPASDVWALGVTIYESLTRVHPFREATQSATLNRIISQEVRDARSLRADCPADLAQLLASTLSRDPRLRPRAADAGEVFARQLKAQARREG